MKFSYSYSDIRTAEEKAIAAGVDVNLLMEKAGLALADAVERAMNGRNVNDCLFVCGQGNNGGDGYVAARILMQRGYEVAVLASGDAQSEAAICARARYSGETLGRIPRRRYAVIIDCIFGTGLSRAPAEEYARLIDFINNSGAYIIACDVPSGLGAGGIAYAPAVHADETVTVGALKSELILADGADLAGIIAVADIGIAQEGEGACIYEDAEIGQFFPKRKSHSHKGTYGTACILGGDSSYGAGVLAASACLKSGVGYTVAYFPPTVYPHLIGRISPAVILRGLNGAKELLPSADCIAVGMGAGVSEMLFESVKELLVNYNGTLVLDADALNTLADYGKGVLRKKGCNAIVTPHPKEFSRLTGIPVAEILRDPIGLAKNFAKKYNVTVILKNNRTVITDGIRVAINSTGTPALAKGGSGDVLAGLLTGTVARGLPPFEASVVACYLLGRAGEFAASEMGEYAPDPTDIIRYLPEAMMSLN